MICLTGDIHHSSQNTSDLSYCRGSEIESAKIMSRIIESYDLNVTFFFTGKCAIEAPKLVKSIADMNNVEIGGHNYWAFPLRKAFNAYFRLTGLYNGPKLFQAFEIRKTIETFKRITNRKIVSWRDHGYRHDSNTRQLLIANQIKYFSDSLSANGHQPFWNDNIIEVPINTLPDHDYVYHGSRLKGTFDETVLLQSVFSTRAMSAEKWLDVVTEKISDHEKENKLSIILTHPACQEVMDKFTVFERLCQFLQQYESIKMMDIERLCFDH